MKYNEIDSEFLSRTSLVEDEEFLDDASDFLYKRTGEVYAEPEEIYAGFMEHMRQGDVNEAVTIMDLSHIRDASDVDKEKIARLYHTYDKMNVFRDDRTLSETVDAFGDYAEGILTAPSTYIGILTGGLAKGSSIAGQQVAKAAIRKQLVSSITKRGALIGAGTEATIGGLQGERKEQIRVELDPDYEYSVGNIAAQSALSALPGGVFGGLSARKGAKQGIRAERISQIGTERVARKNAAAEEAARQTITSASDTQKRQISQILVGAGDDIRTEKLPQSEHLLSQLDDGTQIRIQGAAIELGADLKPITFADGTTERITETIARSIADGSINARNFTEVMDKYNLNSAQLALLFTADVSRAARTLQRAGQVARVRNMAEAIARQSEEGVSEGDLARALDGGFSRTDIEEISSYQQITKAFSEGFMGFEQMRRGLMTTQLQTTQRNIAGGGMRVFLDEVENIFSTGVRSAGIKLGLSSAEETVPSKMTAGSMMKYMFNQSEADVIAKAYAGAMPKEAHRLFAEFIDVADTQALSGVGGALSSFGRKMNWANMKADNFFKRAIFAGQLDRLTRSKYNKSITEMLAEGNMDKISVDMYRNATNKAYELLYQKTPSNKSAIGKFANSYLQIDKLPVVGMATGMVMPFPRFVFNQFEFVMERAPLLGIAYNAAFKKDAGYIEMGVKQLSGLAMVGAFAGFRATQGPDTKWYNYTNEKGETVNLAPMLAGFTPFLYMGDVVYRALSEKADIPKTSTIVSELGKALTGVEGFRVGADKTLFDRTIPEAFKGIYEDGEVSIRTGEELGKLAGDYVATLGYNAFSGVARDAYGLYDDEARMILETNGEIRFWDAFVMRSTRGLPAFVRDPIINSYDPDIKLKPRPVAERAEDTKVQIPLSTTVTGMNIQASESALEREFNRLNMDIYDVYRPHPFGPADVMLRQRLGDRLNKTGLAVMATDEYKNNLTSAGKRQMLKEELSEIINEEKSVVFDAIRSEIESGEDTRISLDDLEKFEFESSGNADKREQIIFEFKKKYELPQDYEVGEDSSDWSKLNDLMKAMYAKGGLVQKFAEGGMVGDPLSLSETLEEEDAGAREEAGDSYVDEMIGLGLDSKDSASRSNLRSDSKLGKPPTTGKKTSSTAAMAKKTD